MSLSSCKQSRCVSSFYDIFVSAQIRTIWYGGKSMGLWNQKIRVSDSQSATYQLCDLRQVTLTTLRFSLLLCKIRMWYLPHMGNSKSLCL